MAKAGIPLYVWGINPADAANESTYGNPQATICLECPRQINGYVTKLEKAKKIGILGYSVTENSKLAAEGIRDAITKYSDQIGGAQVVYFNEDVPFGVPNGLGPEVSAMKDKGVDLIFAALDLNAMKTLAQEAARQGMGDVHMVHANTYDQKFVQEAGNLFEGDIMEVALRPFEAATGQSDLSTFKDWMAKAGARAGRAGARRLDRSPDRLRRHRRRRPAVRSRQGDRGVQQDAQRLHRRWAHPAPGLRAQPHRAHRGDPRPVRSQAQLHDPAEGEERQVRRHRRQGQAVLLLAR